MLALLGLILGLIIVAICIPIKIFQLGLSVKNTKTKLDVKKEKAKNSSIKGKLSQLGKRKNSDNADKEKKPLLTGNKDIQKLKVSQGNKKEQKKVIKKINLKTKMADLIIAQLRALLGILLPTGQSLIIAGLFSALIFLVALVALIAACSFVVMLFNGSGGSGGSFFAGSNGNDEGVKTSTQTGDAVRDMATWYIEHVDTYQSDFHHKDRCCGTTGHEYYESVKDDETKYKVQSGCGYYYCDLINDWVRDDCTGFAAAVATLASGEKVAISYSSAMLGSWDAEQHGYKKFSHTELTDVSELQAGAIIVTDGHAEVIVDAQSTFGWGGIQSSYPKSKAVLLKSDGIKIGDDKRAYTTIYMYER